MSLATALWNVFGHPAHLSHCCSVKDVQYDCFAKFNMYTSHITRYQQLLSTAKQVADPEGLSASGSWSQEHVHASRPEQKDSSTFGLHDPESLKRRWYKNFQRDTLHRHGAADAQVGRYLQPAELPTTRRTMQFCAAWYSMARC